MAYTPYEWTVNSYLNPTRMNAIEQGIAEASQAAESASGEFHTIEELIGTQSIAGIGDGTLTGATWKINSDLTELSATVTTLNSNLISAQGQLNALGKDYVRFFNITSGSGSGAENVVNDVIAKLGSFSDRVYVYGMQQASGVRCFYGYLYKINDALYGVINVDNLGGTKQAVFISNNNKTTKTVSTT